MKMQSQIAFNRVSVTSASIECSYFVFMFQHPNCSFHTQILIFSNRCHFVLSQKACVFSHTHPDRNWSHYYFWLFTHRVRKTFVIKWQKNSTLENVLLWLFFPKKTLRERKCTFYVASARFLKHKHSLSLSLSHTHTHTHKVVVT